MEEEERTLRGRAAIERAHSGSAFLDESRVNSAISELYGVDIDEAMDIHANFHTERVIALLTRRARDYGMAEKALLGTLASLDLHGVAVKVASGSMTEAAACEVLFNAIRSIESKGKSEDRYLAFYG